MFEDKFSSTQINKDFIEKIIRECKKDLLDDDEDDVEDDLIEVEDKINEPSNIMRNQSQKMEEKYNIDKKKNKVLQGKVINIKENKITDDKQKVELSRMCTEQKKKILELKTDRGGVEAAKVKKELKTERTS